MIERFGSCHCSESKPASEVIQKATEYLHNPDKWGRYNLINRNCEHFAVFCKTEQLASGQVGRTLIGWIQSLLEEGLVTRQGRIQDFRKGVLKLINNSYNTCWVL